MNLVIIAIKRVLLKMIRLVNHISSVMLKLSLARQRSRVMFSVAVKVYRNHHTIV